MKYLISAIGLLALFSPAARGEGLSGTWTTGAGATAQTFVLKVRGDTFDGLVCGPCDDPASVFKIEDGRMLDADRVRFFIAYDVGGPQFRKHGPYRDQVNATLSGNQLTLRAQREGATDAPVATVLKRVVSEYAGVNPSVVPSATIGPRPNWQPSPIEGKWVAAGRVAQQNFILKIRDNKVWGLVCGPCNPDGVFMIDDGTVDGSALTFHINHLDTPPSARKSGVNRNIMKGTLVGNVMKFKWVREGAEDQPGGEMVLIGPIRPTPDAK